MCCWILKENGQAIAWSTVHVFFRKNHRETEKQKREQFEKAVTEFIDKFDTKLILEFPSDELEETRQENSNALTNARTNDTNDVSMGLDLIINAKINLSERDRAELGKVIDQKWNANGLLIGRKHQNPMLDLPLYIIEFPDGGTQEVSYNAITEHLFSQVDSKGNQYQIFCEIINHCKKKGVRDKANQYQHQGTKQVKKKTIAGWDLEVEWCDGTMSWIPLKEIKVTNAVKVAEYAKMNWIDDEPAFDWWIHDILKHKERLIKMSQSYCKLTGYKFGLCIPMTVEEAMEIGQESGNTLWFDAIQKKM